MVLLKRIYETEGEMPDTQSLVIETLEKEGIETFMMTHKISDSLMKGRQDWIGVKEQDFERANKLIIALVESEIL